MSKLIDRIFRHRHFSIGVLASWILVQLLCVADCPTASAETVDWKVFGASSFDSRTSVCFYDANGIQQEENLQFQVWTKCLLTDELQKISSDDQKGKLALEIAANKIVGGYFPPIIKALPTDDNDKIMEYVLEEEIANQDIVAPETSLLFEIDCKNRKIRVLSLRGHSKGKEVTSNVPLSWEYIEPETNSSRLRLLVCPV